MVFVADICSIVSEFKLVVNCYLSEFFYLRELLLWAYCYGSKFYEWELFFRQIII